MNGKNKITVLYCIICTVLFVSVFCIYSYNNKLPSAAAAVIVTVLFCIVTAGGALLISKYVHGKNNMGDAPPKGMRSSSGLLSVLKTPAAIIDAEGRFVWRNEHLADTSPLPIHKDTLITDVCSASVKDIASSGKDGVLCSMGDRFFRVFGYPQVSNGKKLITTLWFDTTEEENLKAKCENERLIVCYIIIDMADNFISGMQEQYAEAATAVTKLLKTWAESCNGYIKEYASGKYLMMFEALHLNGFRRASFPVLSDVKKITFGDDAIQMTLSVGIANASGNINEKCALAASAVEFALQRGGDQVVIKHDDGARDEFFGGLAKHDPQLTSLNARRLITQAVPFIKKAGSIIIMGHKNADFDCLASCIGMAKICLSLGKKVTLVIKNNVTISKPYAMLKESPVYKDLFYDFDRDDFDMIEHDSLLFIMDVNNCKIFENAEMTNHASSIIIIDHHRKTDSTFPFDTKITYIEPSASSASEIVAQMLEQFFPSGVLTPLEANLLLAGIQLDTNNFTRDCGAGTYAAAQYLRREGADATEASSYFTLSQNTFIQELKIESTMRMYRDKYAICTGSDDLIVTDSATSARVAETVMKLEGVSASFAICRTAPKATDEPTYSISARSDGTVNVQMILERLGGGGHHSNAGTQLTTGKVIELYDGPLPRLNAEAVAKLLEAAIDYKPNNI